MYIMILRILGFDKAFARSGIFSYTRHNIRSWPEHVLIGCHFNLKLHINTKCILMTGSCIFFAFYYMISIKFANYEALILNAYKWLMLHLCAFITCLNIRYADYGSCISENKTYL